MKKPASFLRYVVLLGITVLLSSHLFAAIDPVVNRWQGSQVSVNSTYSIQDNRWTTVQNSGGANALFEDKRCQSIVGLHFDPDDNTYQAAAFELKVSLDITYQDDHGVTTTITPELIITYDPADKTTYQAKNYYAFEDGYLIDITVTGIEKDQIPISMLPSYAYLEGSIEVERYWFFDRRTATGQMQYVIPFTMNSPTGEIEAHWNTMDAAEEYDFEWIYVDDYKSTAGTYHSSYQLKYDFTREATRITTSQDFYRLSHLFGHGYVIFRVRPVGRDIADPDQRQPGEWSLSDTGTVSAVSWGARCYVAVAHKDSLNWQAQLSFIEEGKKKEVISYHDGSLRGRQTVSRVDTDSNAVVAESYYDFEGRPAVQALPTPVPQGVINYYPNFNLSQQNTGKAFSWEDFDKDNPQASTCATKINKMDSTAGTARYYSDQNPDQEAQQAYVPHAFGYPFSRVEYMPDQTGRIRRQGGVGEDYQLESGQETKYFYGEPYQEELDRLFGTETGYAIRYKQNMVVDPNGQVSISYLDAHGRTIATALAGDGPNNVDILPHNYGDSTFFVSLMAFNDSMDTGGWRVQKEHLAKSNGYHYLDYSLDGAFFQDSCMLACYDCVYDLNIRIIDECKEVKFSLDTTIYPLNLLDTLCDTNGVVFSMLDTVYLTVGSYQIIKELTVNQYALNYYTNQYLEQSTCLKTKNDFIQAALDSMDFSGCYKDPCEWECVYKLGTVTEYLEKYPDRDTSQYISDSLECVQGCQGSGTDCDGVLTFLAGDIHPGGQYGLYDVTNGVYSAANYPYSVYDTTGIDSLQYFVSLTGWSSPYNYTNPNLIYTNDQGIPDTINGVLPNQLSLRDFIKNYRLSWGDTLAKYLHPDNCIYYNCLMTQASYAFDDSIFAVNDYASAVAAGYIVNDTLNLPYIDPYFSGPGAGQLNAMIAAIWGLNYTGTNSSQQTISLNMHQVATLQVFCPHLDSTAADTTILACADTANLFTDSCLNTQAWLFLRGLYIGEKHKLLDSLLDQNACANHNIPGKRHHYINLPTLVGVNPNQVMDSILQQTVRKVDSSFQSVCDSICSGYVSYWWGQLDSCDIDAMDSTTIMSLLIEICKAGCDGTHPLGASSLPPGVSIPGTQHTTFAGVIDSVLSKSSDPNDPSFDPNCNAWLISMPPPYGHSLSSASSTFPTMDTCSCHLLLENRENFLQLQTATNLPQGVSTQADLLFYDYGITVLDVNGKLCACEDAYAQDDTNPWTTTSNWGQGAVNYLDSLYIPIDAAIACPRCLSCSTLQAFVADSLPAGLDTLSNGHFVFTNILNQQFGYNLGYWDYRDFLDSCEVFDNHLDDLQDFLNQMTGLDSLLGQGIGLDSIPSALYDTSCAPVFTSGLVYNWRPNAGFSSYYMLKDSGQVLVGAEWNENGNTEFRLGRLDKLHRWQYIKEMTFLDDYFFLPHQVSIFETPDSNLLVYGLVKAHPTPLIPDSTSGDGIGLIMFDGNGNKLWAQTYMLSIEELAVDVHFLEIGGLEVFQDTSYDRYALMYEVDEAFRGSRESHLRILSFTQSGEFLWENHYPDLDRPFRGFFDEVQQHDNGFVFAACPLHLSSQYFGLFTVDALGIKTEGIFYDNLYPLPETYGLEKTSDGYRVIVEEGNPISDPNLIVFEVDDDSLNYRWMKEYDLNALSTYGSPVGNYDIETTWDNGFIISGSARDSAVAANQIYFLARFDSAGVLLWVDSLTDNSISGLSDQHWLRVEERIANQYSLLRNDTSEALLHYVYPHRLCEHGPLNLEANTVTSYGNKYTPTYIDKNRDSTLWFPTFENPDTYKDPECGEKLVFTYRDDCGTECEVILRIDSSALATLATYTPGPSFTNITNFFDPQYIDDTTFSFRAQYVHNGLVDTVLVIGTSSCFAPGHGPTLCNEAFSPYMVDTLSCENYLTALANHHGAIAYQKYIDSVRNDFRYRYSQHCLKQATETFDMQYQNNEYHYTLYYYNQGGNLVKTVPPHGTDFLDASQFPAVKASRASNGTAILPSHAMVTRYEYNSLGELIAKHTPDDGQSEMWYDRLGRAVVSQNSKQSANDHYGYVLYDELGRINESGQTWDTNTMTHSISKDDAALNSWLQANASSRHERTISHYDFPINNTINQLFPDKQEWLRGRVATIEYRDETDTSYHYATHYSYDVRGNAKEVITEYPDLAHLGENYKRITYDYDLLSGNVNRVIYQPSEPDMLIHTYSYDADNRLHEVYSSRDSLYYDQEAKYFYYQHGPLARIEIGQQQVQGVDYAYTLQGWLKGVNSNTLQYFRDIGKDGDAGSSYVSTIDSMHFRFGRDAFGFSLGYYDSDYSSIKSIPSTDYFVAHDFDDNNSYLSANLKPLFNGNINHMVTALMDTAQQIAPVQATLYYYDQLHRITGLWAYTDTGVVTTNQWQLPTSNGDYTSSFSYDAAGNILTLNRNSYIASGNQDMDDLTYNYYTGTNRLEYVEDQVDPNFHAEDVDGQNLMNYQYDNIGNLISDEAEEIDSIIWDSRNKIREIRRTSTSTKPNLEFKYDAAGNRILKIVKPADTTQEAWTYTYYMRDPSGNPLAIYGRSFAKVSVLPTTWDAVGTYADLFKEKEYVLYGSSRLGMQLDGDTLKFRTFDVPGYEPDGSFSSQDFNDIARIPPQTDTLQRLRRGFKRYELSNHLGNVLVTVSDRKLQLGNDNNLMGYTPDVWMGQDYYPFGMTMSGRSWTQNDSYRFGFQGQEQDQEYYSGAVSYKYRVHDPRIGRFLSIDPLAPDYPWNSPYAFSENRVIDAVELEGLEQVQIHDVPGTQDLTQGNVDLGQISEMGDVASADAADLIHRRENRQGSSQNNNNRNRTRTKSNSPSVGDALKLGGKGLGLFAAFMSPIDMGKSQPPQGAVLTESTMRMIYEKVYPEYKNQKPRDGNDDDSDDDWVSIWKAPQKGMKDKLMSGSGFNTKNFTPKYGGRGAAFFGWEREVAEEYARVYGEGIIEIRIPRELFDQEMFPQLRPIGAESLRSSIREMQGRPGLNEIPVQPEYFPLLNVSPKFHYNY